MKPRSRMQIAGAAVGLIIGGLVLKSIAGRIYFTPRAELRDEIDQLRGALDQFSIAETAHEKMVVELQDIADHTFGPNRESVESALRARLNRIAEDIALVSPVVSTGQAALKASPARRSMNRRNPFRDEPDFGELDASITGEGTLEQVIRLVHRISAEAWTNRIDSLVIDPVASDGRFKVTVRLTTMFLPGRSPSNVESLAQYDDRGLEHGLHVAAVNPFALPAPPVAVAQVPDPPAPVTPPDEPPPPPPPPPSARDKLKNWKVTMVTESSVGPEVWLLNTENKQWQTLAVGESFRGLELIVTREDEAEFKFAEKVFAVRVGSMVADAAPQ